MPTFGQEEAEAKQLGIELLKPGDRAELVLGDRPDLVLSNRKEEHRDTNKETEEDSQAEDRMEGRTRCLLSKGLYMSTNRSLFHGGRWSSVASNISLSRGREASIEYEPC